MLHNKHLRQHKRQQQQWQCPQPSCCHVHHVRARAGPYFTTDTVTQEAFQEPEYESTRQGQKRKAWAAAVRSATGRQHHLVWEPVLDPPLLLANVAVVLVGPKKPISCGTIARSCSCFELNDLRIVQPRCQPNTRSSRSVSKGAQWILHRSTQYDNLMDALSDVSLSVAMSRWLPDSPTCLPNLPSLLQHPVLQQLLQHPLDKAGQADQQQTQARAAGSLQQQEQAQPIQQHRSDSHIVSDQSQPSQSIRVAFVFGREEFGLSDDEVAACDLACSIPIGRLQESLSLSHAVTIVLSQLYQARMAATAADPQSPRYHVHRPDDLADGYDSSGTEH